MYDVTESYMDKRFKVQDRSMDFNVTIHEKHGTMFSDSTL